MMRRRTVHAIFAGLALIFAAMTLYQVLALARLNRINQAIVAVSTREPGHAASGSEAPRVILAQALAFAQKGELDPAVKEFTRLTVRTPADDASRAALFDLGNLYLRRGLALVGGNALGAVPFIELAKQRYRDLLRLDPEQWDARYNLERALRLAPEAQSVFSDFGRESERRPNIAPRDDIVAPDLP